MAKEQTTQPNIDPIDNDANSDVKIANETNNNQTNNPFNQLAHFIDQRLSYLHLTQQKVLQKQQMLLEKVQKIDEQQQDLFTLFSDLSPMHQNGPSMHIASPPASTYLFCDGEISNCEYLKRLKQQMASAESDATDDDNRIESILENFLHLLAKHSNDQDILDDDFQYIYNYLGADCDLQKCSSFRRHSSYRRETAERDELLKEYDVKDDRDIIRKHTVDKIHCFYRHSYDVGHKLTPGEINDIILAKAHNEDEVINVNKGLIKTRDILSKKRNRILNRLHVFGNTRNNKFNQFQNFVTPDDGKYNYETEETHEMYKFGFKFDYDSGDGVYGNGMAVHPQYENIKEELLINDIVTLSIGQFEYEHQRAKLHYQCQYFRSYIHELVERNTHANHEHSDGDTDVSDTSSHSVSVKELKLHHILALMVYCNFTTLQCKFSETYRIAVQNESKQSILKRHSAFYFLGKFLKEVVNDYGEDSKLSNVNTFYHGINTELLFSKTCDLEIYCPLSTSSSYAVAVNFATNGGIIIELKPTPTQTLVATKHFSVSWLSDFPSESERLFIQNDGNFDFENILHIPTGTDLKLVLMCIQILDNPKKGVVMDECQDLLCKLIKNELNPKSFKQLHVYASDMFHEYCINTKEFYAQKSLFQTNLSFLTELFCVEEFPDWDWIDLDFVMKLYPKLEELIYTCDIYLCDQTMGEIYNCLTKNKQWTLKHIMIASVKNSGFEEVLKNYEEKFKQLSFGFWFEEGDDRDTLYILEKNYFKDNMDKFDAIGQSQMIRTFFAN
eukprot:676881_1